MFMILFFNYIGRVGNYLIIMPFQVSVTCLFYFWKNVHFLYFLSEYKISHDTLFAYSEDITKQAGAELCQAQ